MSRGATRLEDLAKLAGVSISTASRALNDSPAVNQRTKQLIWKLAREMDYPFRRYMPAGPIGAEATIALVTPRPQGRDSGMSDPFFLELLAGVGEAAKERGCDVILSHIAPANFEDLAAFAYTSRGAAYSNLGNHRQAIEDYGKAIEINPGYADAYSNRGLAYSNLGNYRQAIGDFNKAIEINPGYADAYSNRGNAYGSLGNYKQAIEDFNRAIEIKPGFAEAYSNRGTAYNGLGNYRQAIEDLDRAIEIKPDYLEAYYNRALAYLKQGDNISGCRDAQKACELGNCKLLEAASTKGLCR